jgi:uncharacterized membrane protein
MNFWILAISYWIHLLATVVWLGGMVLMALVALPALRKGTLANNQWFDLQRRFLPWADVSLVLLLFTGFVQMTNDPNYNGFLAVDSVWAWAILFKHIAFVGMVMIMAYVQFVLYPGMERLRLMGEKRPSLAETEQTKLNHREVLMLRLNLLCAVVVLLFTAIATAV